MTMSSSVSKVTLNGDGVQTAWPFSFKVWKAADLEISITNAEGVTTVVSNWSVSLASAGGTVTYPTSGPALPSGHKITIARSMDFLQDVDLVSGTRWDPEVVETALDIACAERQQLKERLARAVTVDIASGTTPEALRDAIFAAKDTAVSSASSALDSAERAEIAANSVGVLSASGTLTAGQDTITLPWSYDTGTGNIAVFLGGVKQLRSTLTFLTSTTVRVGVAVTENTPYEVMSVTLSAESVLTGLRDQCVTAKTAAETAQSGSEIARTGAETAQAAAEAAVATLRAKGFQAIKTADQTGIASATVTKVTFPSEIEDTDGWYNAATSEFTPPAGVYLIEASLQFSAGVVDGYGFRVILNKNGSTFRQKLVVASSAITVHPSISCFVKANGTDVFTVYAYGEGAGNKTVAGEESTTSFSAYKVE